MYVPDVELHQVTTLDEAASLMARHAPDARLLAGGTDLLVDLKTGRVAVGHLVSLNRIDELRGIAKTEAGLRIGALTTITELGDSPVVREGIAPILDAAMQMAARQIRNMATVGGNVSCAVPCADLPPILTAMKAGVQLWSPGGERGVALEGFYAGPRQTILRDDEVLTAVVVPGSPRGFGALLAGHAVEFPLSIAAPRVHKLAAAYASDDADCVIDVTRALLGFGTGLTPSGDDLTGAALFGRRFVAPHRPEWIAAANTLSGAVETRSHAISAALFGDLARCTSFAPLHAFAVALANEDFEGAMHAAGTLTSIGHSSGWDMLTGIMIGITGYLP